MNEEIAKKTIQQMMNKENKEKVKKSLKDTIFDLYSNIGLVFGFIVFMFSLGVIFGFVTYSVVGARQMIDKVNKAFPRAKKEPKIEAIKQDNIAV